MAEFEHDEHPEEMLRPSWLPENFKTPEDLAESYRHAQNKIRQQGAQLNAMNDNFASLSEQLAAYEEALVAQHAEPYEQSDTLATMHRLTQEQQAPQWQPAAVNVIAVAEQGERLAASQLQDYGQYQGRVLDLFTNDASWRSQFEQAAATGNPATVAGVISGAVQTLTANGELRSMDTRSMKQNAQGISGGQSGHPDGVTTEEQAWAKIRDVNMRDYSSLARGEGR